VPWPSPPFRAGPHTGRRTALATALPTPNC